MERIAQIEDDIRCERFDFSLARYESAYAPSDRPPLSELWMQYTIHKAKVLTVTTINKDYRRVRNHIATLPTQDPQHAETIRRHLANTLTPGSAKKILQFINACCRWAVEEGLLRKNPFQGMAIAARKPRPNIDPFTQSERRIILESFEREKPRYLPLVRFAFLTGCRPSETAALIWDCVDPDLTTLTIAEALVERQRKDTKTHTIRQFPINPQLRSLFRDIGPKGGNQPIFTSPSGKSLDPHNFSEREWKPLVSRLPIRYRVFYNARHSFITHCLSQGIPVATVARWVGNSPEIIYQRYAGYTQGLDVPEI